MKKIIQQLSQLKLWKDIEALARRLLAAIEMFYESKEGERGFEKWSKRNAVT